MTWIYLDYMNVSFMMFLDLKKAIIPKAKKKKKKRLNIGNCINSIFFIES